MLKRGVVVVIFIAVLTCAYFAWSLGSHSRALTGRSSDPGSRSEADSAGAIRGHGAHVADAVSRPLLPEASVRRNANASDAHAAKDDPATLTPHRPVNAWQPGAFFFNLGPWDSKAILASGALNPRGVSLADGEQVLLDAYVELARSTLRDRIEAHKKEISEEFQRQIKDGTARKSSRQVQMSEGPENSVRGSLVFDKKSGRSRSDVMQWYDGASATTYAVDWTELPFSRPTRQALASEIALLVNGLFELLMSVQVLTADEYGDLMAIVFGFIEQF